MVMVMTAISIVICVIVLDLHHHEPTHPVPNWLRRIVFRWMARVLCMRIPFDPQLSQDLDQAARRLFSRSVRRHSSSRAYPGSAEDGGLTDNGGIHEQEMDVAVQYLHEELESLVEPRSRQKPVLEEILDHLREITDKMKRNILREQIKEEWRLVAKVIDRFLLIIFLLAITSLSLGILYIYPQIKMPDFV